MANDNFYGYKRNPNKVKTLQGARGSVDLDFESINPYEFKKGMNAELAKLGVNLRESEAEQREKATETVLKNLNDVPAYYSYMEHYETFTRNMDNKPSFKSFLKELEGHSMKEINEKFTEGKMKEVKLKESVRAEVRRLIRETFLREQEEADMDTDVSADEPGAEGGSEEKSLPDVKRILQYISRIDRKPEFLQLFTALMQHKANIKPEIQPALLLKLFRELNQR